MKNIYIKIIPVFMLLFVACTQDDETEGVSRTTFYNDIYLEGNAEMVLTVGTPYVEPGATAFEGELEVTENLEISGEVDHTSVGLYQVDYNIVNVDGFPKTVSRNVFVLPADRYSDNTSDEKYAGTYTGEVSTGSHPDATVITHIGNGLYECSDFIGGRYNYGFAYGPAYKLSGYFYVNAAGTEHTAVVINSVWGVWNMSTPSISGTTFSHGVAYGATPGSAIRDVVLIKQ